MILGCAVISRSVRLGDLCRECYRFTGQGRCSCKPTVESCCVEERLKGGAGLPEGLHCAVELSVRVAPAAYESFDMPGPGINGYQCTLGLNGTSCAFL